MSHTIDALNALCDQWNLDALFLTSKDEFLSEYVPLENNLRYGATGFTGSVGDALFFSSAFCRATGLDRNLHLFVDGRYHLQADRECSLDQVKVHKLNVEPEIAGTVLGLIEKIKPKAIGFDSSRMPLSYWKSVAEVLDRHSIQSRAISSSDFLKALKLPGYQQNHKIESLSTTVTGRSLSKNLLALSLHLIEKGEAFETLFFTGSTDDAAFLLNARGYALPYHSSVLAFTFLIGNEFVIYLPDSSKECEIDPEILKNTGEFRLKIIRSNPLELQTWIQSNAPKRIVCQGSTVNLSWVNHLKEWIPQAEWNFESVFIRDQRATKTAAEMVSIRSSFLRSSRAIAKTLRFAKSESSKRPLSERELANVLYDHYKEEGARSLSFKSIVGAGPNSAIIHYSQPSDQVFFKSGDLGLVDSGAYYAEGFATDCTRGFFVQNETGTLKPSDWQKKIYTACLKAAISVFLNPVPKNLSGKAVDLLVREKIREQGFDYLHGTGHGIGIHVHEEGIRFSQMSQYDQRAFACVSVEPGIYLEGQGGVRVENVVLLQPHDEHHYRYENVVWVGYEWALVDVSLLTAEEKAHLKAYEMQCRELGTQISECPL